ncbi:MAG: EpsI family protein [Candidatus Omnitrophica bacterium]|nr:EpsI family protein [Candidatus Omnitrophota bacterium]
MVTSLTRPQPIALLFLAASAGLLWTGQHHASRPVMAREPMPTTLGTWTSTPIPVDRRAIDILETEDVELLEYKQAQEPPVWLAHVGGFGNRAAFHPPELCYVGSHFEVLERGPITVTANGQSRRLMRLVIGQEKARFEAWYWFTANGRVTPNYYQQQLWLLLDALYSKPMGGTLMRISTAFDDPARSHQRLLAFLTAWETRHQPTTP